MTDHQPLTGRAIRQAPSTVPPGPWRGSGPLAPPDGVRPEDLTGAYSLLIAQPTSLCNVDCAYCYLPNRKQPRRMPLDVARAIAQGISDQALAEPVTISWHGGEPLATGRDHFEKLLDVFEPLRSAGRVEHNIQTNATLIDDAWCAFFARYQVRLGVSIDGPAELNAHRRDWRGQPMFDRVMRGIGRLRAHELPFSVIAVVSGETIDRGADLLRFMEQLEPESLGINIEERAQTNSARPLVSFERAEAFWRVVIQHLRGGSQLRIREIALLAGYLKTRKAGHTYSRPRDAVPTVGWSGEVCVLSPEFADARAAGYDHFVVGNIRQQGLQDIIARAAQARYVREFAAGVAHCRASCSLFEFCLGGYASHRFFEHGRLDGTETHFCRSSRQALVTAALAEIRQPTAVTSSDRQLAAILADLASDPG